MHPLSTDGAILILVFHTLVSPWVIYTQSAASELLSWGWVWMHWKPIHIVSGLAYWQIHHCMCMLGQRPPGLTMYLWKIQSYFCDVSGGVHFKRANVNSTSIFRLCFNVNICNSSCAKKEYMKMKWQRWKTEDHRSTISLHVHVYMMSWTNPKVFQSI